MTTKPTRYGVRRMCIAVDLEHYSRRTDAEQVEAQRAMARIVREAGERGALERAQWITQEQGDGELALLPPGIDEARVITALWRELREGLHRYNRHANATARLRMRIAAHEGQTYLADNGFAGDAINTVCRLRDCAEVKDALSAVAGDLVLIVSDRIFYDVIRGYDAHDLPASAFTEVTIVMPDKGFRACAFIFGDGGRARPQSRRAPAERPLPSPEKEEGDGSGFGISIGSIERARDIAGRDITNNYGTRDE